MIKVVFFDLFFTLVCPEYSKGRNEYDLIGVSKDLWLEMSEDEELYRERALGKVVEPYKIIEAIVNKLNVKCNQEMISEILNLRQKRFRDALIDVDQQIIDALKLLKDMGVKLCLISNADVIDVAYWRDSPLYEYFEEAIFSYEVGFMKPEAEIYECALQRMDVSPENTVFVGDGGSNELEGAKKLGISTIQSTYYVENDRKSHSDYKVGNFKDVIDVIKNC